MKANRQIAIFLGLLLIVAVSVRAQENEYSGKMITEIIGAGVGKDTVEAAKWYQKAAAQGDVGAQYNLGVAYYKGQGVPKDATEAVKWFRPAVEQDHAAAKFNLGVCYLYGERRNQR